MALKWIATNNGGFWEDDGSGSSTTMPSPQVYQPAPSPQPAQPAQSFNSVVSQPITIQDKNFNNPFIQGALNQCNIAAAQASINVTNAINAAQNSGVRVSPNNYSQITQPLIQSGDFGTPAIGNTLTPAQLTAVNQKIAADQEWQLAYENDPILKRALSDSAKTGRPVMDIINSTEAYKSVLNRIPQWSALNPTYVETRDPYLDDEKPWLRQNAGMVSGIIAALATAGGAAPFAAGLYGTGANLAIGGIGTAKQNFWQPFAGAYATDLAGKSGLLGKEIQANISQRMAGVPLNTPWTGNPANPTNLPPASPPPASVPNGGLSPADTDIEQIRSQFDPFENTMTQSEAIPGYNTPGSPGFIPSTEVSKVIQDVGKTMDKQNGNTSITDLFKAGKTFEALQQIAATPAGAATIAGIIGKIFNNESAPEQTTVDTQGINMTAEYINRMKPEFYKMSQMEKDFIYNNAMEKINANLAQRGVTRGAASIQAASDLLKEIEVEDMRQQREYASRTFDNFVNYINGREDIALRNYAADTANFNAERAAFNNTIANLVQSTLGSNKAPTYKFITTDGGVTYQIG